MSLPQVPLATGTVTIAGTEVPIRALSRSEVIHLQTFQGTEDDAEPYIVARGAGLTDEAAAAWLNSVDNQTGGLLILGILRLSGLTKLSDPLMGSTGAGPTAQP